MSDYDSVADPRVNVLVVPTAGDQLVPVNTGIQIGVAAGTVGLETPDPRYGKSQLRQIVDSHTHEPIDRLGRYTFDVRIDPEGICDWSTMEQRRGIFDLDHLDEGLGEADAPSPESLLRATVATGPDDALQALETCSDDACGTLWMAPGGVSAMRIPYLDHRGQHGFQPPGGPCRRFDIDRYMLNLLGHYFRTGGTELPDAICLADDSCDFLPD